MKHRSLNSAALVGCAVIAISLLGTAPAHAREAATDSLSVLSDVSAASSDPTTDVLANVAHVTPSIRGADAIDATIGDIDVTVPTDPSDPLILVSESARLQIALPFAARASKAEIVTEGVVSYDNGNSSTTVPIVKNDGSLQIATIIENATAPTRYAYQLGLPAGSTASLQNDGGVLLLDADGTYLGGVAPAWATDASGAKIRTHYELDGTTLTQVVDHKATSVAYPVVADPWLGMELISRTSWSGNTLRVYPTDYGRWGASLARSAAWDEVKAKTPGTRENTSSMTDQFLCHFDTRPATSTKASWNLELNRPYINYAALIANRCNN